jgi:hypothetical protein
LLHEHPHVADTTHDDRSEEDVFLGNDRTTPNFWMYSFRAKKVMMLSDPKHWDHILPLMQPWDVSHKIALTDANIRAMLLMVIRTVMCPWLLLLRVQRRPLNYSLQGS